MHYDPDLWPNPTKFDPDRFNTAEKSEKNPSGNFLPFGIGPRDCIGKHMSGFGLIVGTVLCCGIAVYAVLRCGCGSSLC